MLLKRKARTALFATYRHDFLVVEATEEESLCGLAQMLVKRSKVVETLGEGAQGTAQCRFRRAAGSIRKLGE